MSLIEDYKEEFQEEYQPSDTPTEGVGYVVLTYIGDELLGTYVFTTEKKAWDAVEFMAEDDAEIDTFKIRLAMIDSPIPFMDTVH